MRPVNDTELDDLLSNPTPGLGESLADADGDLVVLGAGGKMGPTLVAMARRALDEVGSSRQVVAVSRYSAPGQRRRIDELGVHTVAADLSDPEQVAGLPDAGQVVYMLGMKFGSSDNQDATWWSNAAVPAFVASRYRRVPTVVYSTGNVYPLVPVGSGGCSETHPLGPVGEYAQSCMARERVFSHAADQWGTPTTIFRLNYAAELRYGVLTDIARQVVADHPVDLTMPAVNAVWQRDAVDWSLRCFDMAATPAAVLNATGPETVAVRTLATWIGEALERTPQFTGEPAPDALLSDAGLCLSRYGYPTMPLRTLAHWVAEWVSGGGPLLDKPTKFQQRTGAF